MKPRFFLLLSFLVLLGGCGQWGGLPVPTAKKVVPKDIVGSWVLEGSRPIEPNKPVRYVLQMDLNPDGTYYEKINVEGQDAPIEQKGTWEIEDGWIVLKDLLVEEWDQEKDVGIWKAEGTRWFIVDGVGSLPFEIFGGLFGDPDSWHSFKKER